MAQEQILDGNADQAQACSVCGVYPGHDIDAHIAAVKAEVQEGIADGSFPVTIRTFSELHDYADANMLRGLGDSLSPLDVDEDDEDAQQALSDIFNLVTDAVSAWLAAGRTDAPLTPDLRIRALAAYIEAHSDIITLSGAVHGIPRPHAISAQYGGEDVVIDATPDGWLFDGLPALLPNGQPIAPADIYLVGWAVLDRLGVEYRR